MKETHSILKSIFAVLMVLVMAVTMAVPAMANTRDHWERNDTAPSITNNKVGISIKDIYRQGSTLKLNGWISNGFDYPIVNTHITNLSVTAKNTSETIIYNVSFRHLGKIYPNSYTDFSITIPSQNWNHNVDFSNVGSLSKDFHYTWDNENTAINSHYTKSNMKYVDWNYGLQARVVDARYKNGKFAVKMQIKNPNTTEVVVTSYSLKVVADHKIQIAHGTFDSRVIAVTPNTTFTYTFNFTGQSFHEIDLSKVNYLECAVTNSSGSVSSISRPNK